MLMLICEFFNKKYYLIFKDFRFREKLKLKYYFLFNID